MTSATTRRANVLLAAGGTAGHVYPALAVADAMRERGWDVSFAGTRHGRERAILAGTGYDIALLPGAPYHRTTPLGRLRALLTIPFAVVSAARVVLRRRIDCVIGFGGYASVGPVLAARLLGRHIAILEPNARIGKANRLLLPHADTVYIGIDTKLEAERAEVCRIGIPVRAAFAMTGRRAVAEHSSTRSILVLGDSFLDTHVPDLVNALATKVRVVHQGTKQNVYGPEVEARYETHLDAIWNEYASADLVVSRAGAGALAEIAMTGRASLIVPLRTAAEDHQTENAMPWKERGAALVVNERDWNPEQLARLVDELFDDEGALESMAFRATAASAPAAVRRLVDDIAARLLKVTEREAPVAGPSAPRVSR